MLLRYTSAASRGAGSSNNNMLRRLKKPVLTVLRWQVAATVALALIAGLWSGVHGAASALAGGLVSIVAGLVSALVASMGAQSAGEIVLSALRAEAVKVGLCVLLLWLVLANYHQVVAAALIAAFALTILIFAMAFFVRDT